MNAKTILIGGLLTISLAAGSTAAAAHHPKGKPNKPGKHSTRYLTVIHLKQGLVRGGHGRSPVAQHAFALEAAAFKHKVSPYAIAAIAGFESTFGINGCPDNPRNIWGLGACGGAWSEPYFETWKEAFNYMAVFLLRTWKRAKSVHDLHGYCTCGGWSYTVARYMRYFWGKGPGLRY